MRVVPDSLKLVIVYVKVHAARLVFRALGVIKAYQVGRHFRVVVNDRHLPKVVAQLGLAKQAEVVLVVSALPRVPVIAVFLFVYELEVEPVKVQLFNLKLEQLYVEAGLRVHLVVGDPQLPYVFFGQIVGLFIDDMIRHLAAYPERRLPPPVPYNEHVVGGDDYILLPAKAANAGNDVRYLLFVVLFDVALVRLDRLRVNPVFVFAVVKRSVAFA